MSEISDPWIKIRESRLTKSVQDLRSAGRKFKSKYNFDPSIKGKLLLSHFDKKKTNENLLGELTNCWHTFRKKILPNSALALTFTTNTIY